MSQSNSNNDSSGNGDTPPTSSTGQRNESTNMVQGLSDTAQTIGASLQAMQTVLVGNMQQAAQMTLSMNKMMEELVKRSLQISVFADKPSNSTESSVYRIKLRVAASNKSPIPLQSAHVKLWFWPQQELGEGNIQMKVASIQKDGANMTFEETIGELPEKYDDETPFIQTLSGVCVASGATTEAELELEIDKLQQLNGCIALEFSSPGTGQQLSVSHRFGIHLLQFADCFFARDQSALEDAELATVSGTLPVTVDIARMRTLFRVPPVDGIDIGCLLVIRTHEILFALRVAAVLPGARTATCEWLATKRTAESDSQELMQRLVEELSTLENNLGQACQK
ncbi:hypothetical protein H4R20_000005 [Coemansia guatemalensis]|uniref:Uncharacterized protein n=1 Tax=Coemansia guatemalensis TaxID=2761395 RepID=A0A9W8LW86_9FUNG|nr:hypothetical protein H4R20_000005 [Coemansia guatemalensis]